MKKDKKAIQNLSIKDKIKAMQLLTSEDYLKALEEWEEIQKKVSGETALTGKEEWALLKRGNELKNHIRSTHGILWPYKKGFLESVVNGKSNAPLMYDEQRPVIPIRTEDSRFFKNQSGDFIFTTPDKHLLIEIDPTRNRAEIHHLIDMYLDRLNAFGFGKQDDKRFRAEQLQDLKIWREYQRLGGSPAKQNYREIALKLGLRVGVVKAGWCREYARRNGKPYDPQKTRHIRHTKGRDEATTLCSKCQTPKCYHGEDWKPCKKYIALTDKDPLKEKYMNEEEVSLYLFGERPAKP